MQLVSRSEATCDEVWAWALIRAISQRARAGAAIQQSVALTWDSNHCLQEVAVERAQLLLEPDAEPCFQALCRLTPEARQLLDLYLPLCVGRSANDLVLGHVGQSLDGQIATASGASRYVTGPENIVHLHRLRSLVDAVVVGAGTVDADDPALTTRLVPGEHATRVVIDPRLRVPHARKLYRDGAAPTLIVCERGHAVRGGPARIPLLEVAADGSGLCVPELLSVLAARGLRRIFVEGGGVTISHFIRAQRLDRLHVTICPIIIGRGRPGICLPGVERLEQALRPATRSFNLGSDVLFDCRLATP